MDQPGPNAENGREDAQASSLINRTDLGLTIIILIGCGFLYWVTTGFEIVPDLFAQDVPPEFFPRLLIWTIVILTLALPFEHLFLGEKGKSLNKDRAHRIKPMAGITALLLFGVIVSILWLGTALSMFFVCLALPVLWGERRIKVIVPYAIILPMAVTVLFSYVLGVHFETGVFGITLR